MGDQLTLSHTLRRLPTDDMRGKSGAMLIYVVPEIRERLVWPKNQDLTHATERVAGVAEKFVLGPHFAAVLTGTVMVRLEMLLLHFVPM